MKGFVYLAGQYRKPGGPHDHRGYFDIEANINKAREWAAKFARAGIPFFAPHLNSAHFEVIAPDVSADFWLQMDIVLLLKSCAVFLMPGWHESAGARAEFNLSQIQGIPTFERFGTLRDWWEAGE